jgi:Zn-dependent protease
MIEHIDTPAARENRARAPDAIYNADGTIALGAPPRRANGDTATGNRRGQVVRLLAWLVPALLLLSKLKFLAIFGKFGITGVSMLVSVWAYAALWNLGWAAAVGFVVLLFVHEMGHWAVMRLKGVPASAPLFIPFLGAVIGMKSMPRSVKDEAEIGIAGPIAGTAGALACLGLEVLYGGPLWPFLAYVGLLLNLFNLLPVSPLDGGRIVAAISRWLWPVGLAGLIGLFLLHPNPFLLLIAVIGGIETIARFRGRHAPTTLPGYYDIGGRERATIGVLYFGLIALIAVTMLANPVAGHLG